MYEDFAEPFGLSECQLAIMQCAGHQDPPLIMSIWSQIFDKEIAKVGNAESSTKMAVLGAALKRLARQYASSEQYFPLEHVIKTLELYAVKFQYQEPLWLPNTLLSAGIPLLRIYKAYVKVHSARDNVWKAEGAPHHLVTVIDRITKIFAENPNSLPAPERKGTRKSGWDTCPKLKIAKRRAKFWYRIWLDSNKAINGTLFNLFQRTKKEYSMLVDRAKIENADRVSKETIRNPNYMWKCFKKSRPESRPVSNIIKEECVKHYSGVLKSKNLKLESDSETSLKCLSVNAKTIEFFIFGSPPCMQNSTQISPGISYVVVCEAKVLPEIQLKYLGITYGCSVTSTRTVLVENISKAITPSYAILAFLKYTFNRKVLSRLYSAVGLPHLLYIALLWERLAPTEKLKLSSAYCKNLKFLLRMPLHKRNSPLLNHYNMHDPRDILPELCISTTFDSTKQQQSAISRIKANFLTDIEPTTLVSSTPATQAFTSSLGPTPFSTTIEENSTPTSLSTPTFVKTSTTTTIYSTRSTTLSEISHSTASSSLPLSSTRSTEQSPISLQTTPNAFTSTGSTPTRNPSTSATLLSTSMSTINLTGMTGNTNTESTNMVTTHPSESSSCMTSLSTEYNNTDVSGSTNNPSTKTTDNSSFPSTLKTSTKKSTIDLQTTNDVSINTDDSKTTATTLNPFTGSTSRTTYILTSPVTPTYTTDTVTSETDLTVITDTGYTNGKTTPLSQTSLNITSSPNTLKTTTDANNLSTLSRTNGITSATSGSNHTTIESNTETTVHFTITSVTSERTTSLQTSSLEKTTNFLPETTLYLSSSSTESTADIHVTTKLTAASAFTTSLINETTNYRSSTVSAPMETPCNCNPVKPIPLWAIILPSILGAIILSALCLMFLLLKKKKKKMISNDKNQFVEEGPTDNDSQSTLENTVNTSVTPHVYNIIPRVGIPHAPPLIRSKRRVGTFTLTHRASPKIKITNVQEEKKQILVCLKVRPDERPTTYFLKSLKSET
ncbi:hypothetical protein QYM36_016979, partial [Artemia franciscana]